MAKVMLVCSIVGNGSVVIVDIDPCKKLVGHVKISIKEKKLHVVKCPADEVQLFWAKTAWLSSGTEDVKKLKNGETTALVEVLTREDQNLLDEALIETAMKGMDPPSGNQIHVLVVLLEEDLGSSVSAVELFHNGLNPQVPHLAREELVDNICECMKSNRNRFILFVSPAGSGKTSFLSLFALRYPLLNCIPISFLRPEVSAVDLLRECGLDIYNRRVGLNATQDHVMVGDAQAKYDDKGFWSTLIKVAPSWLPGNIRFIICATHALEGGVESPVEFLSVVKFGRCEFLLSDVEAEQFLLLPKAGLPDKIKKPNFVQLLIRECSGLVGALRISVDSVVDFFVKNPAPLETELIRYFLSQDCLQLIARCFGSHHTAVRFEAQTVSYRMPSWCTECFAVGIWGMLKTIAAVQP